MTVENRTNLNRLLARIEAQIASRRLRAELLQGERELRMEAQILNEIARELAAELLKNLGPHRRQPAHSRIFHSPNGREREVPL